MEYEVGAILEGKVTSITKFGAFVALEGGKSGLVHISEIANTYVNDVHDFLQEGQVVKVKLLAPAKPQYKQQIQPDAQQRRSAQKPEGRHGVPAARSRQAKKL